MTKNHAADPEIGFLTKSIFKRYGRAEAMPTALELDWTIIVIEVSCSAAQNW